MRVYEAYTYGGGPALRESAVLFLDILGTTGPRTPEQEQRALDAIHQALLRARGWQDGAAADADVVTRWFSDNLGMAYPVTDESPPAAALCTLIASTAGHQLALIPEGRAVRGAITLGLLYADERLLFGPGINRAVTLEKTRALYPRVVLDEAAARTARERLAASHSDSSAGSFRMSLAVDGEGVTFVDYLGDGLSVDFEPAAAERLLQQHRDFVAERLVRHDGDPRIADKYRWLAAYHDWFLETVPERWGVELDNDALRVDCTRPLPASFRRFGH